MATQGPRLVLQCYMLIKQELSTMLWNSSEIGSDTAGNATKFATPDHREREKCISAHKPSWTFTDCIPKGGSHLFYRGKETAVSLPCASFPVVTKSFALDVSQQPISKRLTKRLKYIIKLLFHGVSRRGHWRLST